VHNSFPDEGLILSDYHPNLLWRGTHGNWFSLPPE
jgi:hypothetical protein